MTPKRIPEFHPDKLELACWLDLFQMNCVVNDIQEENAKRALLLSSVGVETFATVCKLTAPKLPSEVPYNELVTVLKAHFITKPSYHRALCEFLQRKKRVNENVKAYYADLKQLAQQCDFGAEFDRRLKEQLLIGIDQEIYFKVLLADPFDFKTVSSGDLLAKITSLETAYVTECPTSLAQGNSVNKVKAGQVNNKPGKSSSRSKSKEAPGNLSGKCYRCGLSNHRADKCKYKEATCYSCGKTGHVSSVCMGKKDKFSKVHSLNESKYSDSSSEEENSSHSYDLCMLFDENLNSVESNHGKDEPHKEILKLNDVPIEFELDTGSGVSTISKKVVDKLRVPISQSKKKLFNYDKKEIKVYGEMKCDVTVNGKVAKGQVFYIVDNAVNLAGRGLMKKLKYRWVQVDAINCENSISKNNLSNYKIQEKFPIFNYECNLQLKENAVPKYFKARSVPYHYKAKIEKALQELEADNVISKVEHAGEWASPIVPVLKPSGDVRICVDFKYVNTQTNLNTFPLPKLEDILANLGCCNFISKLDLKNAYLQLSVSEESRKYLIMNTHLGLYKFNRLPFGLSSAPGIFQRFITELLNNVEGVQVFLDDIIIVGETQEQHEGRLNKVLRILQSKNVKLNKNKCQISAHEVPYLGYILSGEGIRPDPKKIQAIVEAPTPNSVTALKSFLGLCTYYNRFVAQFSSILCPLYDLTQKNVNFKWSRIHNKSFKTIKEALAHANILDNFNPKATLILEVDASPVGVGAVLKQNFKDKISTIAFKSRKLSKAECNYSQIDKEALSIVFGVQKFSDFLLGKEFVIRTDHKPLIHLFNPCKNIPQMSNARIQRWALFLSAFKFQIEHIKGESNTVADALSRLPLTWDDSEFNVPGEYINLISVLEDNLSFDFNVVKTCTENDTVLCQIRNFVKEGFPDISKIDISLMPFYKIRNDLSLHDDVLLYRNRVIIPVTLQKCVMDVLHEGHKGIVAMKAEARAIVYWPTMDQDINQITANCSFCITNLKPKSILPLSWPSVDKPWSRLHIDYCGPIENNYFLIIIDAYSKFIDVYPCKSITSEGTINCLKRCFANFGIPDTVVSDNASCFMSQETQDFFKKHGIIHRSGAPYNPITNGLAERAVRVFKENIKKFDVKLPMPARITKFLYSYRRSIQSSTSCSPAELLFARKFKGPLDIIMSKQPVHSNFNDTKFQMGDSVYQNSKFQMGDAVYAKNFGRGPEWIEAKITKVLGNRNYLVSVNSDGNLTWKRHLSQLFERKLYNNSKDFCMSPPGVGVPSVPYMPLPSRSQDNSVITVQNNNTDQGEQENCKQNVNKDLNEIPQPQSRPEVSLRRSTRISKKPNRYIEQSN